MSAFAAGCRARTEKVLALMADLVPLLKKRAGIREFSGIKVYDQ
jgi:type I restriction enzyme, R subunit